MTKSKRPGTPKKWQTDDVERAGGESANRTPSNRRSAPASPTDEEVSPAGTFDTALTSPSTFDDSVRPQKITFEHNVKTTPGGSRARGGAGLLLGMSKPAFAIVTMMILGAGGAAAFGWFQIPGLTSQIEELEAQVAVLSGEIDRLSQENDRYESLNNELNQTVEDFRDLNQDLNATVVELQVIKDELNTTQLELIERVQELRAENENYSLLNNELNTTATRLAQEVDFFEVTLAKLVLENNALSNLTEALQEVTTEIGNITVAQNETLNGLYEVLGGLSAENDRLESLNGDLVTVVSFLNETSLGLGNSLQQITDYLADQIVANQVLVAEILENTYRQRVQAWDCDYRDHFREESFGQDFNVLISDISSVVDYVGQRVLSELCLDKVDFEDYLLAQYQDGLNSFRLTRGVSDYATTALDYYFPEIGEVGITPEEWSEARFDCQNLDNVYSWRANAPVR